MQYNSNVERLGQLLLNVAQTSHLHLEDFNPYSAILVWSTPLTTKNEDIIEGKINWHSIIKKLPKKIDESTTLDNIYIGRQKSTDTIA